MRPSTEAGGLNGSNLRARALVQRLDTPQVSSVIQGVDEFGRQLDVVAKHLLVLRDAVDVTHPPGQIPVHAGRQFTVPQLWRTWDTS